MILLTERKKQSYHPIGLLLICLASSQLLNLGLTEEVTAKYELIKFSQYSEIVKAGLHGSSIIWASLIFIRELRIRLIYINTKR